MAMGFVQLPQREEAQPGQHDAEQNAPSAPNGFPPLTGIDSLTPELAGELFHILVFEVSSTLHLAGSVPQKGRNDHSSL
jgi:hypothetical protein